jgi:predicted MFS family arabinose efflux permease
MGVPRETWVVFSISTINSLGFSATLPFLAVYLQVARNVPLSTIGLLYLATGILGLGSLIGGGRLTDSIGAKKVMLTGYVFSFGSSLILGYLVFINAGVFSFFILYPIFSFLRGLSQPAISSVIASQTLSARMRTGFSFLNVGGNLGFAIGPAIAGPIIDISSYSTVFLLSASTALLSAGITFYFVKNPATDISTHEKINQGFRRWLGWKEDRSIILFLVLTFLLTVANGYEITPLSLYVAGFLHFSNSLIGFLFATNGALIAALQLPLSRLMEKSPRLVIPLVISAAFNAASFLLAANSTTFGEYELVMVLVTLGEIFLSVPAQTIVALFSRAGNRGTYQGFYSAASNTGRSIASFVGPTSFQLLAFDPPLAWYSVAVLAVASGIGFLALSPSLERDYRTMVVGKEEPIC